VLAEEITVAAVVVLFTVRVASLTVRVWALDMPPPGVGLNTVILLAPAVVRSLAGIVPVSWVELTKAVVLSAPSRRTTDAPLTKFVPLTVKVKPASPTVLVVGEMLVVVGAG
jgi:energy-converting hydrogenase Eha subunit G